MKLAQIPDQEVLALIRELTLGAELPSGVQLRRALQAKFGIRGGVSRIYRLLAEEKARLKRPPTPETLEQLLIQTQELRDRAALAEERERVHQERWAAELDQLRLALSALQLSHAQACDALKTNEWLRRQLYAAEARNASLEQQLLDAEQLLDRNRGSS